MWDELACSLNNLRQCDPVESFVAFKIVVISSPFEGFEVQLLDDYDFRVIEFEQIVNDGIVLSLQNFDGCNRRLDCHIEDGSVA